MGSLKDSFQSSNFFIGTLCCCCSLLISVSGKTYKSAINRPILKSERTMLCGSIRTGLQTDVKLYGRTDSWTNVQMDRRADLSKSDTTGEFNF